ncbi:hypothetical protein ASC75_24255 [Aminobacter sp. DSM 101952]|uniref:M20/M25/M40 family metallo-hydrolase n=1 Tax=Aminobacter sp. DSM 101952 TaxID=2735891 RepID=UPI0006F9C771|nr:M20/M25/M40 family metallo-hydrolase [Aminobacter sp. DSM 101952]KQU71600.1 hypothetical protein ASC75_24255 [Aminobacter sp. DSM 101952]
MSMVPWPSLERASVASLVNEICGIGNRFVGTAGEAATRSFLLDRFNSAGLQKVRAEPVELLSYEAGGATCEILKPSRTLRAVGLQYTASGQAEGVAIYIGRPSSIEDLTDLLTRLPPLNGRIAVMHSYWPWLFAEHLVDRGVSGIVVISETPGGTISHLTAQLYPVPSAPSFEGRPLAVPGVTIDRDDGAQLLAYVANGVVRLRIEHRARYKPFISANVVGEIPGNTAECVVVGAHYDTQLEGVGAQDNATGLAALLALADRWVGQNFRRTLKLVAFCAEEPGMWGATDYCRRHEADLKSTVAMINLDALAWALPGRRALLADPGIADYAVARAAEVGWEIEDVTNASLLRAADLNPFIDAGVPACWFWRFPPQHPYYHSSGDVPELLDMAAVSEVANVAAYTAYSLLNDGDLNLGRAQGLPTDDLSRGSSSRGDQCNLLDNLEKQLEQLRHRLGTMRVTLRLDVNGRNFPVIGEAVAEGFPSIKHDESVDQRGASTAQWVMRTRKILVQSEFANSPVRPPTALIDAYGVKAQMLAPVVHNDHVAGWISVHSSTRRDWNAADVAELEEEARNISRCLPSIREAVRATPGWTVMLEPSS